LRNILFVPIALLAACGSSKPSPPTVPAPPASDEGYGYTFEVETAASATAASVPTGLPLGPGGRLYPEAISGMVRIHFGAMLTCYQAGLNKDSKLAGTVTVNCVFGEDGVPKQVTDGGSTLPDKDVIDCMLDKFRKLRFSASKSGDVSVVYPMRFAPSDLPERQ